MNTNSCFLSDIFCGHITVSETQSSDFSNSNLQLCGFVLEPLIANYDTFNRT